MTNSRTLRAKTPADLLAMVPYVLGFHPEDSVVLLTLGGAANRFHARVDLPEQPDDISELVEYLGGVAERNELDRVVIVVYGDDECVAEAMCTPLRSRLEESGVTVVEAIRADGSRWYSLTGCSGPCCPPDGTPYDVSLHPFTAQSVLDGQVTLGSRRELRDSLVGNDPDEVEAVEAAVDEAMKRFKGAGRHPLGPATPEAVRRHLVQEGHWLGDRVRCFLRDGRKLDSADVGRLLVAMVAIEVRDVAWAEMTHTNADRHVDLWRDVVRRAPLDLLAAPAALLGFAAWLSGDGALAWCAIDRCQESEPDYSLAGLLTEALAGAIRPSTWEPFDREMLTLFAS
jgi:hypothetical protein